MSGVLRQTGGSLWGLEIFGRENNPGRPVPWLVRTPHAHVEDQPVQTARSDFRIAEAVELPGARDGDRPGTEGVTVVVHKEGDMAGFEKDDFDALVAVGIESPVLFAARIPVSKTAEAGQHARRHPVARVAPVRDGVQADFPGCHRLFLRRTGIDGVAMALGGLSLHGGVFNIQRRR